MKIEKTLVELNKSNGIFLTDKGSIHKYLEFYDLLFVPYRYKKINIFEVGYQFGGSCFLWELYFPKAVIRSIDIKYWKPTPDRRELNLLNDYQEPGERTTLELINIWSLTDEYFNDFSPDIAIDDGSHILQDQLQFVKLVYPALNKGGILIVEDIQDIDSDIEEFETLGIPFQVIDQRKKSSVYDDVFIFFKK